VDIARLDAVVLRRIKFGDTSLIASVYSDKRGKFSVIAKGARSPRSKRGLSAALETMNLLDLVVYFKESREIQTLSSAEIKKDFRRIKSDLDRYYAAVGFLRIINLFVQENEPSQEIWELILHCMNLLAECDIENIPCLELSFRARFMDVLGYAPQLELCTICGREIESNGFFSAKMGGIVCKTCNLSGIPLDSHEMACLRKVFDADALCCQGLTGNLASKIKIILGKHSQYHMERDITLDLKSRF